MLDEVWLRARRTLVHELMRAEVWPEQGVYPRYMRNKADVGARLVRRLLRSRLPPDDVAALGHESTFGASNYRFRRRLPLVLAFGYTLGSGLFRLTQSPSRLVEEVARTCAVFNLGISVFDLVCDSNGELAAELASVFDRDDLRSLATDPTFSATMRRRRDELTTSEVRLLVSLIAMFFDDVSHLCRISGRAVQPKRLQRLLEEAYAAEQATLRGGRVAERSDSAAVARRSSTLPFTIIAELTRLAGDHSPPDGAVVDEFMEHVALLFGITDDLVDLVADLQSGSLNALLADAGLNAGSKDYERDYAAIESILRGDCLELAAGRARAAAGQALAIISASDLDASAADDLRLAVGCFTRSWME